MRAVGVFARSDLHFFLDDFLRDKVSLFFGIVTLGQIVMDNLLVEA